MPSNIPAIVFGLALCGLTMPCQEVFEASGAATPYCMDITTEHLLAMQKPSSFWGAPRTGAPRVLAPTQVMFMRMAGFLATMSHRKLLALVHR